MKELLSKIVKQNDLCFDIGANKGKVSHELIDLGCNVVSVEPNPFSFEFIENPHKINKACSDKDDEKLILYFPLQVRSVLVDPTGLVTAKVDFMDSNGFREYFSTSKEIESETITINTMIKDYGKPKFIKIDVEGYEAEVLKGLSQAVPYISIEFHNHLRGLFNDAMKEILRLSDKQLRFNVTLEENWKFEFEYWVDTPNLYNFLDDQPDTSWGDVYIQL